MKNIWIVALIVLSGCTVTQPHKLEYRIAPNVTIYKVDANACRDKSLKVRRVFTASSLLSQNMKYVQENYKEYAFTESKWARTPNGAITAALVSSIERQNIFSSVNSFKSRSRSELILETRVEDFMQYFNKDSNSSYVNVALSMTLIDARKNRVLHSKSIEKKLSVASANAEGGVEALNAALSEALQENNRWLLGTCE